MTALAPATLQRLTRVGKPSKNKPAKVVPDGDPLPVQFNPATLRIQRRNNVDRGGTTTGTQKAQHPSSEAATLSFDLEFDTAEQVAAGQPVDVRKWTALVRQFVEPPKDDTGDPPPAVSFSWGTLTFTGIVDQVTEELDYFSPEGTPLHAKVSVSISEQDFGLEAAKGAAARDTKAAVDPGESPAGSAPGSSGTDRPERVVAAQDGESAQQLLARLGKDPAAWRAAMSGLDNPLQLAAGASVQLGPEVDRGGGFGTTEQFAASAATGSVDALAAALGLPATPGAGAPTVVDPADRSAGFILSAAGGVARAAQLVRDTRAKDVTAASRAGFDVPPAAQSAAGAAPAPPDLRAQTYGVGVPLQVRPAPLDTAATTDQPDPARRVGDGRSASLRRRPGGECR